MNNVTNQIANALERGEIPWRLPSFPRNVRTRKPHGGVSPILLNIAAGALGCSSPWWGTILDWQALGSKVPFGVGVGIPSCTDPLHNLEFTNRAYEPPALAEEDPAQMFDAIVKNSGVRIEYGFNASCKYVCADDYIIMPHRMMFEIGPGGVAGYYDALGHELFHYTERRMKWDAHPDVNEWRADVGTGYLGALAGAKPVPLRLAMHHRKFVRRWVKLMRSDPQMLLRVCENVTATVAWLLRFTGREVAWESSCEGALSC